jgi:hypothetical protein
MRLSEEVSRLCGDSDVPAYKAAKLNMVELFWGIATVNGENLIAMSRIERAEKSRKKSKRGKK